MVFKGTRVSRRVPEGSCKGLRRDQEGLMFRRLLEGFKVVLGGSWKDQKGFWKGPGRVEVFGNGLGMV